MIKIQILVFMVILPKFLLIVSIISEIFGYHLLCFLVISRSKSVCDRLDFEISFSTILMLFRRSRKKHFFIKLINSNLKNFFFQSIYLHTHQECVDHHSNDSWLVFPNRRAHHPILLRHLTFHQIVV